MHVSLAIPFELVDCFQETRNESRDIGGFYQEGQKLF
jgi:hypothetical protein